MVESSIHWQFSLQTKLCLTVLEVGKLQFVRMTPSSSYRAEFLKNLKNLSLLHQRQSYNSISGPNANVVILDLTSQESAVFHCVTCVWVLAVFLWNDVGLSQLVQYPLKLNCNTRQPRRRDMVLSKSLNTNVDLLLVLAIIVTQKLTKLKRQLVANWSSPFSKKTTSAYAVLY